MYKIPGADGLQVKKPSVCFFLVSSCLPGQFHFWTFPLKCIKCKTHIIYIQAEAYVYRTSCSNNEPSPDQFTYTNKLMWKSVQKIKHSLLKIQKFKNNIPTQNNNCKTTTLNQTVTSLFCYKRAVLKIIHFMTSNSTE